MCVLWCDTSSPTLLGLVCVGCFVFLQCVYTCVENCPLRITLQAVWDVLFAPSPVMTPKFFYTLHYAIDA